MKVLIWQSAYLGDVVLATSLLQNVLDFFEPQDVGFVGRPFIKDVLYGYDINIYTYDKTLKDSFNILKAIKHYDVALSIHMSLRTAILLYLSGIKKRIGFDRSEAEYLYTDLVHYEMYNTHEIYRNIKLLGLLMGKTLTPKKPKMFINDSVIYSVKQKFNLPKDFVVISPLSNFFLKTWKQDYFLEISKHIDMPVVILSDKVLQAFDNIKNVYNLSGKTTLVEFIHIIALSKLVIANDSSSIHIANAFNKKAISIYCATSSLYGFYPLMGAYLEPELNCHPCSINPKSCKTNTYECLGFVKPMDVIKVLDNILS